MPFASRARTGSATGRSRRSSGARSRIRSRTRRRACRGCRGPRHRRRRRFGRGLRRLGGGAPRLRDRAGAEPSRRRPSRAAGGGAVDGKAIFAEAGCGGCHTLEAAGATGTVGPNLDDAKPSKELVIDRVTNGKGVMPPFKDSYSDGADRSSRRLRRRERRQVASPLSAHVRGQTPSRPQGHVSQTYAKVMSHSR